MSRQFLLGCGIASSALYIVGDILGTLRYPGYRYTEQQVSELFAAGSPVRPLMLAFSGFGYAALVIAFAVGVWTAARPQRAARATGALLIGYALTGLVTGAIFRMDTREVLAAGTGDARNALHAPGTVVMSLCLIVAMGFGAVLRDRRFRFYTYATMLTLVVFGVLASLQAGRMVANQPTPGMGLEERVNIYALMLWIAVLAIALLRAEVEQPEAAPGTPSGAPTARRLTPGVPGGT
jgi:hypothetical protein